MENKQITVTSPLLPDMDEFYLMLKDIWKSKWVTNNGQYHKQLENALCEYLKVPYISLFIRIIDIAVAHIVQGSMVTYKVCSHNLCDFVFLAPFVKTFNSACSNADIPYSEVL